MRKEQRAKKQQHGGRITPRARSTGSREERDPNNSEIEGRERECNAAIPFSRAARPFPFVAFAPVHSSLALCAFVVARGHVRCFPPQLQPPPRQPLRKTSRASQRTARIAPHVAQPSPSPTLVFLRVSSSIPPSLPPSSRPRCVPRPLLLLPLPLPAPRKGRPAADADACRTKTSIESGRLGVGPSAPACRVMLGHQSHPLCAVPSLRVGPSPFSPAPLAHRSAAAVGRWQPVTSPLFWLPLCFTNPHVPLCCLSVSLSLHFIQPWH
jgi:hypothetical protein